MVVGLIAICGCTFFVLVDKFAYSGRELPFHRFLGVHNQPRLMVLVVNCNGI